MLFRVGNGHYVNLWFQAVHISAPAMRGYIRRVQFLRDDILSLGKVSNESAGEGRGTIQQLLNVKQLFESERTETRSSLVGFIHS